MCVICYFSLQLLCLFMYIRQWSFHFWSISKSADSRFISITAVVCAAPFIYWMPSIDYRHQLVLTVNKWELACPKLSRWWTNYVPAFFLSPLGFQHPIRLLDYTNKQQHPRRNKSKEIRQLQPWNGVLFYCLSTERLMIANFSGWWPFRRKEK